MPVNPDQAKFTAALLGEVSPEDQVIFDQALLRSSILREEALSLSRTGQRLRGAFATEAQPGLLPAQRSRLLALSHEEPLPRRTVRPGILHRFRVSALAITVGAAAVTALGIYWYSAGFQVGPVLQKKTESQRTWSAIKVDSIPTGKDFRPPPAPLPPLAAPSLALEPAIPGLPGESLPHLPAPVNPLLSEPPAPLALTPVPAPEPANAPPAVPSGSPAGPRNPVAPPSYSSPRPNP